MDNPRYGTEPPENLPLLSYDGVVGRLLAGPGLGSVVGPFATVTPTQLIDYIFQPNSNLVHIVPLPLDNCLVYVYQGSGSVCGTHVSMYDILRLDATDANMRDIHIQSDNDSDMAILLFSGKMLKEPIAWRGPFVMNTEKELQQTYADYKSGNLLLQRVPWNYKILSEFPAHYHGLNDTTFSSWEEYQDIKT
jgi:redox-sensitive bicupin YhaK (pirin superfamily)